MTCIPSHNAKAPRRVGPNVEQLQNKWNKNYQLSKYMPAATTETESSSTLKQQRITTKYLYNQPNKLLFNQKPLRTKDVFSFQREAQNDNFVSFRIAKFLTTQMK